MCGALPVTMTTTSSSSSSGATTTSTSSSSGATTTSSSGAATASASSSGAATASASSSGGMNCGLTTGDPDCDACINGLCCAQATACVNDNNCLTCLSANPPCTTDPAATNLEDCLAMSCSAQCGGGSSTSSASSSSGTISSSSGTVTTSSSGSSSGGGGAGASSSGSATTSSGGGAGGGGGRRRRDRGRAVLRVRRSRWLRRVPAAPGAVTVTNGTGKLRQRRGHREQLGRPRQQRELAAARPSAARGDPTSPAPIAGLLLGAAFVISRRRR